MSKVTDCARALGEAIVASDEYKNMQIAESTALLRAGPERNVKGVTNLPRDLAFCAGVQYNISIEVGKSG